MEQETSKLLNRVYILGVVLVAGLLLFLGSQMGYQNRYLDLQSQYQITVTGEGKVYVKPDIATVTLGLKTDGQSVKDITKKNVDIINKIIKDVKDLKIDEKDIQTTQYSIYPKYNWTEKTGSVPDGYTIEQNVTIKIRNFDNISGVLQIASNNGANTVSGLTFTVDNPEKARQEARAKAIEQAKANAQNLAKESGISLGKLINVYEGYSPVPVVYNTAKNAMGMGAADSVPAPTIQPGQQEVSVSINLTYQVK